MTYVLIIILYTVYKRTLKQNSPRNMQANVIPNWSLMSLKRLQANLPKSSQKFMSARKAKS